MQERTLKSIAGHAALVIYAALLLFLGIALTYGGYTLARLGGSQYYVLAGMTLIASGALLMFRRIEGVWLYVAAVAVTTAWSLWEVGFDGWALAPRLIVLYVLGLGLLLPTVRRRLRPSTRALTPPPPPCPPPATGGGDRNGGFPPSIAEAGDRNGDVAVRFPPPVAVRFPPPIAVRFPLSIAVRFPPPVAGGGVGWGRLQLSSRTPFVLTLALGIAAGAILHSTRTARPKDPIYRTGSATTASATRLPTTVHTAQAADWLHYGNDAGGARFSELTQLTPQNVDQLEVAWTYRTGDLKASMEVTPLKVGDSVYACTGTNDVFALDAETGAQRWRFDAGTAAEAAIVKACRGVAYYRVPDAAGACSERIITNTIDARLIALDAHTGARCSDFGANGETSLLAGMGDWKGRKIPGYYYVTSAPTIIRGRIVLGGWVADAQYWGEPSGVIRAFDAVTGKFAWAFDMGRPERPSEPPLGEHYTSSTPNAWAPMSADEELGLVYVPTGNTSGSDYYGVQRREFDDKYSSSVLALDADTGRIRWSFQTVHHDLWDYDVAPQPVLTDITRDGQSVRALIQATKTGEIFALDRVTGKPLFDVQELPAPAAGAVPDERISPTQPYSVAMPSFRGPELTEADMWGVTPIDQLWCRIQFKRARYQGMFTPPGITPFIQYPGILGGIEWGGVSIDRDSRLMIVNASRAANYAKLIARAEADAQGRKPVGFGGSYIQRTQAGTPYAVSNPPFLSPLNVPCQQPPFGTLSAIDLDTGKLVWTQSLGSARDSGPLGIRSLLPFTLGTPNIGGSVSTRSGLVFIGATQDRYLRAFEAKTGQLLWKARLPAGGQATPMTYESPASGRQFVVIAASGLGSLLSGSGDYLIAYALPQNRESGH
jgi:quinoprotein glucose dehydrogenase